MDIRFNSPRCDQNLSVEAKGAGMIVDCPNCKEQIEIPRSTASEGIQVSIPTPLSRPPKKGASRFTQTFTSVFLAIIAAVIAIVGAFFLIRPFLQYNEAKRLCLAEMDSALASGRDLSGGLDAQITQLSSSVRRTIRAEQMLISVLSHKPLSLPLTSNERKLLSQAKSDVRRDTLQRLKVAFEVYKAVHDDYPSGTPTEILKALEFDADRTQLNQNGELVDPDGKPYPLEFSQIETLVAQ